MIFIFALTLLYALSNCFFDQIYNEYKSQMGLHSFGRMIIEFATYTQFAHIRRNMAHAIRPIDRFIETNCFYKDIILLLRVFFFIVFPLSLINPAVCVVRSNVYEFVHSNFHYGWVFFCRRHRRCCCCFIEFPIRCNKMTLSCVMWKLFIFIV